MNAIEEKSVSLWMDTATIPSSRPLQKDRSADVVIVGAGIVGLSTAYELANLGMGVIVLDRGRLVGGMTARTSAHLNSNIDDLYEELIRMRGEAEARAYLRMRVRAIDRIEEIQGERRHRLRFPSARRLSLSGEAGRRGDA
jgi:glycine/D-amino acid oxidase-like deaminating enzyme